MDSQFWLGVECMAAALAGTLGVWVYVKWRHTARWHAQLQYSALQGRVADIFPAPVSAHSETMLHNAELSRQLLTLNGQLVERLSAAPVPVPAPAPAVPAPAPAPAPAAAPAPAPAPVSWAVSAPSVRVRVPTLDFTRLTPQPVTAAAPAPTGPPRFEAGEPTTISDFESQQVIVTYLQALIAALGPTEAACSAIAFTGPAGTGKTALMKAFANSLRLRNLDAGHGETDYIELFPQDIATRADLERVLRRATHRPATLRIDEIHAIDPEHAILLYELLANREYRFEGQTTAVAMPNLTVIASTTDWARLHEALRRRFEQMAFEPLSPDEIRAAVLRQPVPIDPDALNDLVDRTRYSGVLWEALRLYRQAHMFAKAGRADRITMAHLQQVYELQGLDAFGLTSTDRRILKVMLGLPRKRRVRDNDEVVAYGGAESHVAQMAQLDLGYYREIIKPKLMARELVTTRSPYGQVLTDRAVALYGHLVHGT
jgi:Holliday junction resolvasome RuvABC ATP-dependent DNA helicase subunit